VDDRLMHGDPVHARHASGALPLSRKARAAAVPDA
jgi:hypothetical protein